MKDLGHRGETITAITFSYGGRTFIASGGGDADRSIKIWNGHDFSLLKQLKGHKGAIPKLVYIHTDKKHLLLSASFDKTIKIWDINSGWSCVSTLQINAMELQFVPSNDGKCIVLIESVNSFLIIDLNNLRGKKNYIIKEFKFGNNAGFAMAVTYPAYASDYKTMLDYQYVVLSDYKKLNIFNCSTGQSVTSFSIKGKLEIFEFYIIPPQVYYLNSSEFTISPQMLVASTNQKIFIYDLLKNKLLIEIKEECLLKSKFIPHLPVYSQDINFLQVNSPGIIGQVRPEEEEEEGEGNFYLFNFWNFGGELVHTIEVPEVVNDFSYFYMSSKSDLIRDLPLLLTSGLKGLFSIWNIVSGEKIKSVDHESFISTNLITNYIPNTSVLIKPQSKYTLEPGKLRILDRQSGKLLVDGINENKITCSIPINLDGKNFVVFGHEKGDIQIWDPISKNFRFVCLLDGHKNKILSLFYYCNNALISTCKDCTLRLWDIKKKLCLRKIDNLGGPISLIQKLPAEEDTSRELLALSNSESILKVYDIQTGEIFNTVYEGIGEGSKKMYYISHLSGTGSPAIVIEADKKCLFRNPYTGSTVKVVNGCNILEIPASKNRPALLATVNVVATVNEIRNELTIQLQETDQILRVLKGHNECNFYINVYIPPSNGNNGFGDIRALASFDSKKMTIWDVDTGAIIKSFKGDFTEALVAEYISYGKDNIPVLCYIQMSSLVFINLKTGEKIKTLKGPRDGFQDIIIIPQSKDSRSPYPEMIAATDFQNTIKFWNLSNFELLFTHKIGKSQTISSCLFIPSSVSIKKPLLVIGTEEGQIALWQFDNGLTQLCTLENHCAISSIVHVPAKEGMAVSLSPHNFTSYHGEMLVTLDMDYNIKFWSLNNYELVRTKQNFSLISKLFIPENESHSMLVETSKNQQSKIIDTRDFRELGQVPIKMATRAYMGEKLIPVIVGTKKQCPRINQNNTFCNTGYDLFVNPKVYQTDKKASKNKVDKSKIKKVDEEEEFNEDEKEELNENEEGEFNENEDNEGEEEIYDEENEGSFDEEVESEELEEPKPKPAKNLRPPMGEKSNQPQKPSKVPDIFIYDIKTWECLKTYTTTHNLLINLLQYVHSNGHNFILTTCNDFAELRNLDTGDFIFKFTQHLHPITSISCLKFGNRDMLITADRDGVVKICDFDGKCVLTIHEDNNAIQNMEIIRIEENNYALCLFEDHVKVWLLSSVKIYNTLKGNFMNYLISGPAY